MANSQDAARWCNGQQLRVFARVDAILMIGIVSSMNRTDGVMTRNITLASGGAVIDDDQLHLAAILVLRLFELLED